MQGAASILDPPFTKEFLRLDPTPARNLTVCAWLLRVHRSLARGAYASGSPARAI